MADTTLELDDITDAENALLGVPFAPEVQANLNRVLAALSTFVGFANQDPDGGPPVTATELANWVQALREEAAARETGLYVVGCDIIPTSLDCDESVELLELALYLAQKPENVSMSQTLELQVVLEGDNKHFCLVEGWDEDTAIEEEDVPVPFCTMGTDQRVGETYELRTSATFLANDRPAFMRLAVSMMQALKQDFFTSEERWQADLLARWLQELKAWLPEATTATTSGYDLASMAPVGQA